MKNLSKSQYTRGLQCHKSLWLYRERKEMMDKKSPSDQAILDQGTEVGILAQKWIKGGVLIAAGHQETDKALEQTAAAIAGGTRVLYEAAFLHDGVLIRADIMTKNIKGNWDLYEVKSTTSVEDEHMDDVAIQRHVLKGAGIKLDVAHLVHLDSSYVRYGPLQLDKLFVAEDVTQETDKKLPQVPAILAAMKTMAQAAEPPKVEIGPHCRKPHECDFQGNCWAHVPDYSVFDLSGARMNKKTELWNDGYKTVQEIPDGEKLTAYQTVQRLVARTQQPYIKAEAIRDFLATLEYPAYFLDFEAVNPAIPAHDGCRPFQAIPFQASIHIRRTPGGGLEHFEFLADGTKDPRPELAGFLKNTIGPRGSIVAYAKAYEGGILKAMAPLPYGGNAMTEFEQRLWDVADPIRKGFYALPAFKGRWSIKAVLPAVAPELQYADLAIAEGTAAMAAYARLMNDPSLTPEQRAKIMADLKVYCGQDTIGMVKILDAFYAAIGTPAAA